MEEEQSRDDSPIMVANNQQEDQSKTNVAACAESQESPV